MLRLHAQPARAQRLEQARDLVERRDVELQARLVQAPRAVVVEAMEVLDDLAAGLEIQRAREPVEDLDALVEARRLALESPRRDVGTRAGDLLQQAVHQDQHELHRGGARRARLEVDGVVAAVGFVVQGDLSNSMEKSGAAISPSTR